MSNLLEHAKTEIKAAKLDEAGYGELLPNAVLELIEVFSKQGHSGMSAGIVRQIFNQLAAYQPLTPLTGEDEEWSEVAPGVFQNKRASHVFRENGQAYDINGKVFERPDGTRYTDGTRVPVTFPYTPTTEIVKVNE